MSKSNVVEFSGREEIADPLTDLLRRAARALIQQVVEAELSEFMDRFEERRLEDGRAAVVRNGYQPERPIQTGIGPVTVKIPKVRAKDGRPVTFRSALVPPYVRKTRSLEAALPWLYLKGVSTGEMESALAALIGPEAKGLSGQHRGAVEAAMGRGIPGMAEDSVGPGSLGFYLWVDGIYSGLRGEDAKLCALVGHWRQRAG